MILFIFSFLRITSLSGFLRDFIVFKRFIKNLFEMLNKIENLIDHFLSGVTVAAALKSEADSLATKHERTEPVLLDVVER